MTEDEVSEEEEPLEVRTAQGYTVKRTRRDKMTRSEGSGGGGGEDGGERLRVVVTIHCVVL